ncbi:MAG: tetratricopeptide repeat protein, partial [Terriglobales bacterium]
IFAACAAGQETGSGTISAEETLTQVRALHAAGRFAMALNPLEIYLTSDPRNTVVRLEYARTLAILRRFPEAAREYRRVLEAEPQNAAALVGVAKVASWQGQNQLALETYERVLARQPSLYDALVGKAFVLLWMGRQEEARTLFQQAQRQYPNDPEVREALASLGQEPGAGSRQTETPAQELQVPAPPLELDSPEPTNAETPEPTPPEKRKRTSPASPPSSAEAVTTGAAPARAPAHPAPILMQAATLLMLAASGMLAYRTRRLRRSSGPLPVNRVRFELPPSTLQAREKEGAREDALLAGRVLVVHPEEEVLDFTRKVLASAGAEVLGLSRGEDAMVRLEKGHYDAVILNETIPGGWSGMEIYRWMQKRSPGSEKRVMLAVPDLSDPERRQFVDDTGVLCITTPFGVSDLIAMTRLLQQKSRTAPATN